MFKDISPDDRSVQEFKTHKQFTFTHTDSGSGVFGLEGISGSYHNYLTGSAPSQSYGVFNSNSQSFGKDWSTWYSHGTFHKIPLYYTIANLYYKYDRIPNPKSTTTKMPVYTATKWSRKDPHGRRDWGSIIPRQLHKKVNVITIPQKYFGEEIKPGSIKILDDSNGTTLDLRDDGHGQLYDNTYSSSFAAGTPGGTPLTGSLVGNVFYEHGLITITDTGSLYISCSLGTGSLSAGQYSGDDGFSVRFKATKTSTEYQYLCNVNKYEFNSSTNPSIVRGRSGSIYVPSDAKYIYDGDIQKGSLYPPLYAKTMDLVLQAASSSYKLTYNPGTLYENFTTHSEFGTYITNVGLYNDSNELLAIAKISNPIKNENDLPLSFLIRFDS